MIHELDAVVLMRDLPDVRLKADNVGTVVLAYEDGAGYELEFTSLSGETLAVVNLPAEAIQPIGPREIAYARVVA